MLELTDEKRHEQRMVSWKTMCKEGRWWTFTKPESLAEDYDLLFGCLEIYRTTIKSYFNGVDFIHKDVGSVAAEGKKQRYIDAGGKYA